ncbi:hypothetical protein LTR37_017990 [Vermiconidia calcicola]|uniref:Uncharacterized protein n=1 Tax=Vermiconidia calcicola TaxID=1690605 RepID=A0ACC3MIL4_9PEZI|nr:hypothetical protein LTR37_017990 [Vermiconidia calcicola]
MTTPIELADRLSNISLSADQQDSSTAVHPRTHILSFKYPDADLLPDDSMTPHLEPPAKLEQRHLPDKNSCNAKTVGTRFFAVLDVLEQPAYLGTASYGISRQLAEAVDRLKSRTGHSWLHMVSFQMSNGVVHRLRLLTSISKTARYLLSGQDFELPDEDWRRLVSGVNRPQWLDVLDNLVTRSSDRAFFAMRLSSYMEEAQWESLWHNRPPRCAEELFFERLQPVTTEDAAGLRTGGDKPLHLTLPCGHDVYIRKIQILALTSEACLVQECSTCGQRILQPEDDVELDLRAEYDSAESYKQRNQTWLELDELDYDRGKPLKLGTNAIVQALEAALESCDMPTTLCPPSLNPVNYPETQQAFSEFKRHYAGTSYPITTSAVELYRGLSSLVSGDGAGEDYHKIIITGRGPLDFPEFRRLWLSRAVNFLFDRRCRRKSADHEGLHEHSDGQYYQLESIGSDDGDLAESDEEEQYEQKLHEVEMMMDEAEI